MTFKIQNLSGSCLALTICAGVLGAQPADLVLRNEAYHAGNGQSTGPRPGGARRQDRCHRH